MRAGPLQSAMVYMDSSVAALEREDGRVIDQLNAEAPSAQGRTAPPTPGLRGTVPARHCESAGQRLVARLAAVTSSPTTEEVTRFVLGIILTTEGSDLGRSKISRCPSLYGLEASVVNVVADPSRCTSHQPVVVDSRSRPICPSASRSRVLDVHGVGRRHSRRVRS